MLYCKNYHPSDQPILTPIAKPPHGPPLYPIEKFLPHYNAYLSDGRKSIAYDDFLSEAYLIEEKYIPRLDFLKTIDTNILKDTE